MTLKENLHKEMVASLPLREAIKVDPTTSIWDAVAQMREKSLGCAIAVDTDDKPVGIFTERGLIDLLLENADLQRETMGDHLYTDLACIGASEPISNAFDMLQTKGCRFLCVLDDEGRVIGLTGQRGISEYIAEHFPEQVMDQRVDGKPMTQQREGA